MTALMWAAFGAGWLLLSATIGGAVLFAMLAMQDRQDERERRREREERDRLEARLRELAPKAAPEELRRYRVAAVATRTWGCSIEDAIAEAEAALRQP